MSLDVTLRLNVCPHCGKCEEEWSQNITHNLNRMAAAAGIYDAVWRPDQHGITKASQVAEVLRAKLPDMEARPDHYRQFNAENGWGTYRDFMPWLWRYLEQCEAWPDADVEVSR